MMFNIGSRQFGSNIFVAFAVVIALASLIYSNKLVERLANEERNKIEIWAQATESLVNETDNDDMNLVLRILHSNNTIPVILHDKNNDTFIANNIKLPQKQQDQFLQKKIERFSEKRDPIVLPDLNQFLYYDDSYILKQLQLFPYIQLGVIALFIALAFFSLRNSLKAQQNKVWVGLSKETAHQLGTPISSLMAWTEFLRLKNIENELLNEIDKDVHRLEMIANRFSKIGSTPDLKQTDLRLMLQNSIHYLSKRISSQVQIITDFPNVAVMASINELLLDWVIENLLKNAVDAMNGEGSIKLTLSEQNKKVILDIRDSGIGIAKSQFKSLFFPGFTTKERGWGLGLSLAKRIIEEYHKGKIYVKESEINKGTTFRIVLKSV